MLKTKNKPGRFFRNGRLAVTVLLSLMVVAATAGLVRADQYDVQIQQLQQQNDTAQNNLNSALATATSYQDAIDKLQAQINGLQQNIVATQQHIDELNNQIAQAQAQLDQEKKTLGEDIKAMYLEGQTSTLEVLASSQNISDFVNKQTYRNAVQDQVKTTLDKINALKAQLVSQQNQQQSALKTQQAEQSQLQSSQNQQSSLLAYTQGQISAYNQQISSNNSQIASLRAQQAAANRALGGSVVAGDPGHGGYPSYWDYPVPQDSLLDNWGMLNRECVSYTAWKVYQTYGYMPGWGFLSEGNANQWPGDARAANIPTSSTPKVGSVAISMGGYYGHAMWVEAVSGNMIYVSQYNFYLDGRYSEMWVNGSNFTYIYFGG